MSRSNAVRASHTGLSAAFVKSKQALPAGPPLSVRGDLAREVWEERFHRFSSLVRKLHFRGVKVNGSYQRLKEASPPERCPCVSQAERHVRKSLIRRLLPLMRRINGRRVEQALRLAAVS